MAEPKLTYTTAEVAAMLDCTEQSVEIAARKGSLPGLQFGRGWVFPAEALGRALNALAAEQASSRSNKQPPAPKAVDVGREAANDAPKRRRGGPPPRPRPALDDLPPMAGAA